MELHTDSINLKTTGINVLGGGLFTGLPIGGLMITYHFSVIWRYGSTYKWLNLLGDNIQWMGSRVRELGDNMIYASAVF